MINSEIVKRYFQALDIIIQTGEISGITEFCDKHGIDRRNFSRLRKEPGRKFYLYLLHIIVENYNVDANYLISGRGRLFLS